MLCRLTASTLILVTAAQAVASQLELQVDQAQSDVNVELCATVQDVAVCEGDASPVAGWVLMSLDCLTQPGAVTVYDFLLQTTEDIALYLDFGLLGGLGAGASDVEVYYADPSTPLPPAQLGGDNGNEFSHPDVSVKVDGLFWYEATGVACFLFQYYDVPCSYSADLEGVPDSGTLQGTVDVVDRDVTMTLNIDEFRSFIPEIAELEGGVRITGTIVAAGSAPLPDVETFVAVLTGAITDGELICESDINADGAADGNDIQQYMVRTLFGGG